jgi:hypothetical protein
MTSSMSCLLAFIGSIRVCSIPTANMIEKGTVDTKDQDAETILTHASIHVHRVFAFFHFNNSRRPAKTIA